MNQSVFTVCMSVTENQQNWTADSNGPKHNNQAQQPKENAALLTPEGNGRCKTDLWAQGWAVAFPRVRARLTRGYRGWVWVNGVGGVFLFAAELNKLDTWATDITSAYLEAFVSEKVFIIAGSEFQGRKGHLLIMHKTLYSLRVSGACWHEHFSDCCMQKASYHARLNLTFGYTQMVESMSI